MRETVIDINHLKYVYPDGFIALDDVNLKILKGERTLKLKWNFPWKLS